MRQPLLYVQVNAADTEFCYDDLVAVVRPGLDGIVLPKVESAVCHEHTTRDGGVKPYER